MNQQQQRSLLLALTLIITCLSGCGTSEPTVKIVEPTLIAQWKFDEGMGDVATDSSGNGNNGTIRKGAWADGIDGSALEMQGSLSPTAADDGIVVVPLSNSLRSTSDAITITAWAWRTAEHNVAIVSHGYPALFFGFHGSQFKWQFRDGPSRSLPSRIMRHLGFHGDPRRRGASCYADERHVAGLHRWIHTAATYDGQNARLYADGVEICSRQYQGSMAMPQAPFTLSGYLNNGKIIDEMSGRLDEVRIYRGALDAEEIRAMYEQHARPGKRDPEPALGE